jgi:hypothetical protein
MLFFLNTTMNNNARLILPRALLLRARDDDDIHIKTEGKIGREQV